MQWKRLLIVGVLMLAIAGGVAAAVVLTRSSSSSDFAESSVASVDDSTAAGADAMARRTTAPPRTQKPTTRSPTTSPPTLPPTTSSSASSTSPSSSSSSSSAPSMKTARPNDGSGYWPDFSNTGYSHTPAMKVGNTPIPAYPGHLTDFQAGMSATNYIQYEWDDNTVISYTRFLASTLLIHGDNLVFVGCLFEGTNPNANLVQIYAAHRITFLHCTFKPATYPLLPPGNNGRVSSSPTHPGTTYDNSWQLASLMTDGCVAVLDHNDIWGNAGLQLISGTPGNPSIWTNNYIHDQADTANDVYHHDGIGPQSEGDGGPMIIYHNTIASLGNTNGIACQGQGVYSFINVTNNYISGWGYAVSIGTINNAHDITFVDNVYSAELEALYGPLYGGIWSGRARNSVWRNNFYQARAGDGNTNYAPVDDGKYWWPGDDTSHTTDFTG